MTLTFELAHFKVREGEEEELLAERPAMVPPGLRHVEVVDEALFYSNSRP